MSTTFAAMKGKLGNTDYFILPLKAGFLAANARIPSETEEWKNLTMSEKEQRDLNYTRVKTQIAPYLAKDKDRFFGAIVLTVRNFDSTKFEPIDTVLTQGLPQLYRSEAESMGFLTFTGGEVFIPIDGQHRIKAIKFALDGLDEKSNKIDGLSPCPDLANEDITVMLVPYESTKVRKIFTRVNRYAKPTTSGESLVTDDEDYIAISARDIADWINLVPSNSSHNVDLVRAKGNALNDSDTYFTTLKTIATCNEVILRASFPDPLPKKGHPYIVDDPVKKDMFDKKILSVWKHLTKKTQEFSVMLSDKSKTGDVKRQGVRKDNLLGKPAPQVCLFDAYTRLIKSNLSPDQATDRLSKVDWRKDAKIWDRILMTGSTIHHKEKNRKIAASMIYYIVGGKYDNERAAAASLLKDYQGLFHKDEKPSKLPEKVV